MLFLSDGRGRAAAYGTMTESGGNMPSVQKARKHTAIFVILALLAGTSSLTIRECGRRVQVRSDVQPHAKVNLRSIHAAETAFLREHHRYGTLEEIGFRPISAKDPYTYRIDGTGAPGTVVPGRRDGSLTPDNGFVRAGLSLDPPGFTATATANLDGDAALDEWHINDEDPVYLMHDRDDLDDIPWRWLGPPWGRPARAR